MLPSMTARDTTTSEGKSSTGDESGEQCDARLGVRVPESLIEEYDRAAFEASTPADRVTRSDLVRQALREFLDELEDGDDGDGEIVTRGFSNGGDDR